MQRTITLFDLRVQECISGMVQYGPGDGPTEHAIRSPERPLLGETTCSYRHTEVGVTRQEKSFFTEANMC